MSFNNMSLEEALNLTKTKSKSDLAAWLGKTKQVITYYAKNGIPLEVERDIKMKLAAQKQERAEAKRLKGVHKID